METPQALNTGDDPGWSVPDTPNLSSRSSPTQLSMFRRSLFEYPAVVREYVDREYVAHKYTRSMIPKGRSILAKGSGGMSNDAVIYTNSRSFKNVYKGRGSLEPSKLLQGMPLGLGMSKGQSILNSGGGLSGMSLFKMKHYNPLESSDDASGFVEMKFSEETGTFDKNGIRLIALDGNLIYDERGKFYTDSRGRKIYDALGHKNIYEDEEEKHTSAGILGLFEISPLETIRQLTASNIVKENIVKENIVEETGYNHRQVLEGELIILQERLRLHEYTGDPSRLEENIKNVQAAIDNQIWIEGNKEKNRQFDLKQSEKLQKSEEKTDWRLAEHVRNTDDSHEIQAITTTVPAKQVVDAPMTAQQLQSKSVRDVIAKSNEVIANKKLHADGVLKQGEDLQNINKKIQTITDPAVLTAVLQLLKDQRHPDTGNPDTDAQFKQITDRMIKYITTKLDKQRGDDIEKMKISLNEDTTTSTLENEQVRFQLNNLRGEEEEEEEEKKPKIKKKPNEATPKKEKQPKKETTTIDDKVKLKRFAMDPSGAMLKDKKDNIIWNKILAINSPNRTYIIETKIKNKWELVPVAGIAIPLHNFLNVSKITKYNEKFKFNKVGDEIIHGKFKITLWTRELRFTDRQYYAE